MDDHCQKGVSSVYSSRLPEGYIRLLKFHTTPLTGDLSYDIIRTPLCSAPPYHALSYAWNGESKPRHISANSIDFRVTESVYNALCDIASIVKKGVGLDLQHIWIDAVCINQDDIRELNEQVRQMGEIYSRAANVLIYLGPVAPDAWNELRFLTRATKESMSGRFCDDMTVRESCKEWAIPELRSRSWFDRAWVVQEVCQARETMVICSDYICPLVDLEEALKAIGYDRNQVSLRDRALHELRDAITLPKRLRRARSSKNPTTNLFLELSNARTLQCTNPRDHVFAFLGLLPPGEIPPYAIDYDRPVADIYLDVTRWAIGHSGFGLLTLEHAGDHKCTIDGLPSWVPDWSMPGKPRYYPWWLYSAGGKDTLQPTDELYQNDGRVLVLSGFILDKVSSIIQLSDVCVDLDSPEGYYKVHPEFVCKTLPGIDLDSVQRTICADLASTYDLTAHQGIIHKRWGHIDGSEDTVQGVLNVNRMKRDLRTELIDIMDPKDSEVFLTFQNGHIGLGRTHVLPQDVAVVFPGIEMPFILRKRQQAPGYEMVGPTYIHGVMDGEAMKALQRSEYSLETFVIT